MKKYWFLAVLAVGLAGCAGADSKDEDESNKCGDRFCNANETCIENHCVITSDLCAGKTCLVGTCNPATGMCEGGTMDLCAGKTCPSGTCNPSTGQCEGGTVDLCAGKTCTSGTCNPATGQCEGGDDESVCGDGDVTGDEVCDPLASMTSTCANYNNSKVWKAGGVPGCDATSCVLTAGTCEEETEPECSVSKPCTDPEKPKCNEFGVCVKEDDPGAVCGDGTVNGTEVCDPKAAMTLTCTDYNSSKTWEDGGKPGCDGTLCVLTQGSCEEVVICGNHKNDEGEICDPTAEMKKSCSDYNNTKRWKSSGKPSCSATCTLEIGTCEEDLCGNGTVDPGEKCDLGLNDSGNAKTSTSCDNYSPKYKSGNVTCTESCTKLDESKCVEDDGKTGLYYCQLMAPVKVEFGSDLSEVVLNGRVAFAGITDKTTGNDGGLDAELIYGTDLEKMTSWKTITATANSSFSDDKIDAYMAKLTKAQYEALGKDDVYYTFRFSEKSKKVWSYCKSNSEHPDLVDGNIEFIEVKSDTETDANVHEIGVATKSTASDANVVAKFTFDHYSGATPTLSTVYSADVGTAKITGSGLQCDSAGCLANDGAGGKAWNVKNWKKNKSDAVSSGAHILITDLNTSGAHNLNLAFDAYRGNDSTAPKNVVVLYSTDGSKFTEVRDIALKTGDGTLKVFINYETSLSSDAEDKESLVIKLVPYGVNGNLRLDNIIVSKNNED